MEPYEAFTQDIIEAEPGPSIGAFFDFDGTIIATHSVKEVFKARLLAGQVSTDELLGMGSMMVRYALKSEDFSDTMASSLRNMRGLSVRGFADLCEQVHEKSLAPAVFPEVKAMIRAHLAMGHTVAIITSATRYQVEPLARQLGIEHVLCTELEVERGHFTGRLEGAACYGDAKVDAAGAFAEEHAIDLDDCWFYSNGAEDIPLLESVGEPVAVNPDRGLAAHAGNEGWKMHELSSRGSAGVLDIARTLATFGSVLPMLAIGLPFKWLGAPEREVNNVAISAWAGLASLLAGLKLIVEGEHHLWSHRPAVFMFNHQSAIDTVICAKLLREDIVGIAKQEIRRQPLMGPALMSVGTVFIDRESAGSPKETLRPALEALESGRSIIIAPEGTRSRDESLGDFKKGGFHLAMQAGVPIVPIVIHNAADSLPGNGMIVRPAEVKVTVLEPIPTHGWTLRSVAKAMRDTRTAYLEALGKEGSSGKESRSRKS